MLLPEASPSNNWAKPQQSNKLLKKEKIKKLKRGEKKEREGGEREVKRINRKGEIN